MDKKIYDWEVKYLRDESKVGFWVTTQVRLDTTSYPKLVDNNSSIMRTHTCHINKDKSFERVLLTSWPNFKSLESHFN